MSFALVFESYANRKMTVIRKASPHPMAANLIRVLSIRILFEYSCEELRSSEVTISIIAVTASHKLISESVKGKFRLIIIE